MAVVVSRMSAETYIATPEDRPEHTELINGTVVVSEPKLPHAHVQTELLYALRHWIGGGKGRGYVSVPADVPIDDFNVFAPDVWWVGEDRRPIPGQLDLDGLPDLVVEIRSPSTWARDLSVKLPAYEAVGVPEAWFVDDVARSILVFRRSSPGSPTFDAPAELGVDADLTSPMLADLSLPVRSIFER